MPYPPSELNVSVDGLNLVATWTEPFSLEGEDITYNVFITNTVTHAYKETVVNVTTYALTESLGERDRAEYRFTIFSRNGYSNSTTGIKGMEAVPTGTYSPRVVLV